MFPVSETDLAFSGVENPSFVKFFLPLICFRYMEMDPRYICSYKPNKKVFPILVESVISHNYQQFAFECVIDQKLTNASFLFAKS